MERPAGCRFWEASDVTDWIAKNVDVKDAPNGPDTAARWWKACIDADAMRDFNLREMAEFCMDGMKATDLQDVTDEIQAPHLDQEDTGSGTPPQWSVAELDNSVEQELRQHFGLDRTTKEVVGG